MRAERPKPTLLVTGASGFIGRHAVRALAARGYRLIALSRHPESANRALEGAPIEWRFCDLLRSDDVTRAVEEAEARTLVHLAWDVTPGYWRSAANLAWLEASLRLVRTFRAAGGRRVVSAGTCAEYDWADPAIALGPIAELRARFAPLTFYAAAKRAFHMALEHYARTDGLSAAWGLVFFPYGEAERSERLVPQVTRALFAGRRPETTEGRQIRDYLDARDAGAAFAALAESDVEGPVNIASGRGVAVRRVIELIQAEIAPTADIAFGALQARPNDPHRLVADVSRLTEEVGFRPQIALEDGIRDAVAWWRAQLARAPSLRGSPSRSAAPGGAAATASPASGSARHGG